MKDGCVCVCVCVRMGEGERRRGVQGEQSVAAKEGAVDHFVAILQALCWPQQGLWVWSLRTYYQGVIRGAKVVVVRALHGRGPHDHRNGQKSRAKQQREEVACDEYVRGWWGRGDHRVVSAAETQGLVTWQHIRPRRPRRLHGWPQSDSTTDLVKQSAHVTR